MRKIYLTRAQTRAMALDHPIGDPTGGAAYGEKNDPVSAVISIGAMGGTYAAAGSFAAMTMMQGLTFAGAALNLAGNVTGNKSLQKIGMVAGLAGGIGSLAEGMGLIDKTATLGDTFGFGGGTGAGLTPPPGSTAPLSQTPNAMAPGPSLADSIGQGAAPMGPANPLSSPLGPAGQVGQMPPSDFSLAGASPSMPPGGVNPAQQGLLRSAAPNMGGAPGLQVGGAPGAALPGATPPGVMDSLAKGNFMDAAKSFGSQSMDLLKNNPTGAYVAANAIGAVGDFLSGKTDAELDALQAQTGYNDAAAQRIQEQIQLERDRRARLNARYEPGAVNTSMGVNRNAQVNMGDKYQYPGPGLIASAAKA